MTESSLANGNIGPSLNWQDKEKPPEPNPAADANEHNLDVRDSLEWLLCSEEATFSGDHDAQRRERQFDLLLWLLHLEPRLTPYPDPHAC